MTHLSLSLLGPFRATLDGQPITAFRANKVRALLAYLAMEAGRPHARTALAGLLWPERPERAALDSLRNALATLRKAIGDRPAIGDREATPPFLLITRETIQFNAASNCWLDVAAFQAATGSPDTRRPVHERLEEAVSLYQGNFLQGFAVRGCPDFESWMLLLRERLQRLALDMLRRLIDLCQASGELERACWAARRQVEIAPWEEEAHRGLMRLLALTGQRGAALAQYETCRRALARELGVEPSKETVALYEQIRAGEVELVPPPLDREREPTPGHPAFLRPQTGYERRVRPTFVARERELADLESRLQDALADQGQVVFVTGEAGTGKTALVAEFARLAESRHAGLLVVTGNCNAYTGSGDPYLPFRELLAQLTGDVEARWSSGALSTQGARRLWRLMPFAIQSLLENSPGLIDAQDGDPIAGLVSGPPLAARAAVAAPGGVGWRKRLDRFLAGQRADGRQSALRPADLHVQATAFLKTLAQREPLLLILDDLQWADAGSIDLLFHLGRRLDGSRILIAGIYRPSDVDVGREDGRHPLAAVVHEFERQYGPISVHLDQVGEQAFVEAFLDSEPNRLDPEFREALYGHTQGLALCVIEMLRDMQERGDLVCDEAGRWVEGPSVDWASLPVRCESVIGERIERLPAALREMLAIASVEGDTFTAEVVARVRGIQAYRAVAQLSGELDRRHRLVTGEGSRQVNPGGPRASRYRFRHILLQQHAYDSLDEAERAYLHEEVGDALEQVYAGQTETIAVQLARHFYAAARMDKAASYSMLAGDQARGLYAHVEARQHYDRALDALAQLPATVESRRRRVDALIARTASAAGSEPWEENLARLTEAERIAQALPGPEGGPEGDRLRLARVHLWMGRVYYPQGRYRQCIAYYQRALSAARERGDNELIGLASSALGHAYASRGHFGQAEAILRQMLDPPERAGDRGEQAQTLMLHGAVLAYIGDYAGGVAEIQRAYARLRETNALTTMAFNRYLLSLVYRAGGDLPHAIEAARQGLAMAEQSGRPVSIYDGHMTLGWALCRAGKLETAASYAAKAHLILREQGGRLVLASELAALDAEIALCSGRVREAVALADKAVDIPQERKTIQSEGLARRTWGQALAALETPQWTEAEAQLAHSLRLFEAGENRLEAARTQEAWGAVCRDRGDLALARAHWEQAAAQWERSGLSHELARTQALIESLASE